MIRRVLRGVWNAITLLRRVLANLLFVALLALLWVVLAEQPEPLPERAALTLDLAGRVLDQRTRVDPTQLFLDADSMDRELLLTDLVSAVDLAAEDQRITALVLELDGLIAIGQSKTTELAAAIERFRAAGKPVVARGDYYTQDQYRLAVEADHILMHPLGAVALEGYSYYGNYFASALDKLSINMHVFRAGDFKSIAEPLLRSDMSPGERQITRAWLNDLWTDYRDRVEQRRALDAGAVDALLGAYPQRLADAGGDPAQLAMQAGLVDELLDRAQQKSYLAALVGAQNEDGAYASVPFADYLQHRGAASQTLEPGQAHIAVVTAQGNIVPGAQALGVIGGDAIARLLRDTAEQDGLGAIVLRLTSGGGSVFASEIVRETMADIREQGIPIVASMGSVAASGGYYVATAAQHIVATPSTLTGSIGVFAAFPTLENLLERGGVYTDGVGTTPLAGGLRVDRPLIPEVESALQQSVDSVYERFLALVMASRGLDRTQADAVAEGRVLSARSALAAGLVDELGGLQEATQSAARLAGLEAGAYEVIMVQPPITAQEQFLQELSEALGAESLGRGALHRLGLDRLNAERLARWLAPATRGLSALEDFKDPRHLYMRCLACEL